MQYKTETVLQLTTDLLLCHVRHNEGFLDLDGWRVGHLDIYCFCDRGCIESVVSSAGILDININLSLTGFPHHYRRLTCPA